jgi:lipid II:glycine glycyltransferase (peptidoglycan interpeptide bridge formation enzyme)
MERDHKATMVVDLSPSEEELLAGMKKGTRYGVRRAAERASPSSRTTPKRGWSCSWRMHGEIVERKNFWSRPRGYYAAVWKAMEDAGKRTCFSPSTRESGWRSPWSTPSATSASTCWAHEAEERDLQPGYLLQWEVMRWAKRQNITHYDMWGIPNLDTVNKSHPYGVYKWKTGFGGEVYDFLGCLDLPVRPPAPGCGTKWNRCTSACTKGSR